MAESDPDADLKSLIVEWHEAQREFELAIIESPGPITTAYQRGTGRQRVLNATSRLIEVAKARGRDAAGLRRLARLLRSPLDKQALVLAPPQREDWLAAAACVDRLSESATCTSSALGHTDAQGLMADNPTRDPFMPPRWFKAEFGIHADRLRSAHRSGRLRAERTTPVGKAARYRYAVRDAMTLWPDDVTYLPDATG